MNRQKDKPFTHTHTTKQLRKEGITLCNVMCRVRMGAMEVWVEAAVCFATP